MSLIIILEVGKSPEHPDISFRVISVPKEHCLAEPPLRRRTTVEVWPANLLDLVHANTLEGKVSIESIKFAHLRLAQKHRVGVR
jgi:hypothetical protein